MAAKRWLNSRELEEAINNLVDEINNPNIEREECDQLSSSSDYYYYFFI